MIAGLLYSATEGPCWPALAYYCVRPSENRPEYPRRWHGWCGIGLGLSIDHGSAAAQQLCDVFWIFALDALNVAVARGVDAGGVVRTELHVA